MRTPSTGDRLLRRRRGPESNVLAIGKRSTAVTRTVVVLFVAYFELGLFRSAAKHCKWPTHPSQRTTPFKVFVGADPQLIDYNSSYPDRSSLLRRLTVIVTDLYAAKSWRSVMHHARPDAIVWLGDLLDAGRSIAQSPDPTAYSTQAHRFHSIFSLPPRTRKTSTIILPGNHDMSIYDGQGHDHFERHFGPTHAVKDWSGWQIVAIDSVALLAGSEQERQWISDIPDTDKPRILLTHVPLHRREGTDCGPKRESSRPIHQGTGQGYQNEMSLQDTEWLFDTLPNVRLVLSGDDHDYCRVEHELKDGTTVNETTIKAFSMAMGVRRPGYELLTLYPPSSDGIDQGLALQQMCLLPDQLGTYLHAYLPVTIIAFFLLLLPRLYRAARRSAPTLAHSNGVLVSTHKHKRSLSRQLLFSADDEPDKVDSYVPDDRDPSAVDHDPHVAGSLVAYYGGDSAGYHAPLDSDGIPSPSRMRRNWTDALDSDAELGLTPSSRLLTNRRSSSFKPAARPTLFLAALSRIRGGLLFETGREYARIVWPAVLFWIAHAAWYLL